jgi:hypothetical protein
MSRSLQEKSVKLKKKTLHKILKKDLQNLNLIANKIQRVILSLIKYHQKWVFLRKRVRKKETEKERILKNQNKGGQQFKISTLHGLIKKLKNSSQF